METVPHKRYVITRQFGREPGYENSFGTLDEAHQQVLKYTHKRWPYKESDYEVIDTWDEPGDVVILRTESGTIWTYVWRSHTTRAIRDPGRLAR